LRFANICIDNLVAINGVRIVSGEKDGFVAMPQSRDKNGEYHDVAFPINSDLRKKLNRFSISTKKPSKTAAGRLTHSFARARSRSTSTNTKRRRSRKPPPPRKLQGLEIKEARRWRM
jgi:DNA-binding cell septation regulator SpoVG